MKGFVTLEWMSSYSLLMVSDTRFPPLASSAAVAIANTLQSLTPNCFGLFSFLILDPYSEEKKEDSVQAGQWSHEENRTLLGNQLDILTQWCQSKDSLEYAQSAKEGGAVARLVQNRVN